MDSYERFGVPTVINAAGKLTALGGTAQSLEVARAQAEAARRHVDLEALRRRAGKLVALATGAEAACVTSGAAAGIVVATAATIVGADPHLVARVPDTEGLANRVLIQAGHWVHFGAPVEQMVRLGGGRPARVGTVGGVSGAELAAALEASDVAAMLFVQSHHTFGEGMLPLDRCVELARAAGVPVIVDAAAEEDLHRYVEAGADLVTYSGGKAFGGPTAGFVAGRADLVAACEAQGRGVARPMKVGKEQILGLLVALEQYAAHDAPAEQARRARVNAIVLEALSAGPPVDARLVPDEAGRPIERVAVSGIDVRALVAFLAAGSPSIRTRNHHLDAGVVLIDPREVTEEQAQVIAGRLRTFLDGGAGARARR